MSKYRLVWAVLAAVCLVGASSGISAQGSIEQARNRCEALINANFMGVTDAPTQITSTTLIAAAEESPAYCQVKGYITPNVNFELQLPVENWNSKFVHAGCGGFCGDVYPVLCKDPVRRGYACVASDMGHKSKGLQAIWAYNNLQAEIDWGYRATHVATMAGKAISEHFYRQEPNRSYYIGCSTGGRQGLVSAQRFPWDFDGIVAGAPVIAVTDTSMNMVWDNAAVKADEGRPIFLQKDLQVWHEAVLKKCDGADGVADGLVSDPLSCDFKPAEIMCKPGQSENCLTAEQVAAAQKLYDGPTNSEGMKLTPGGFSISGELDVGKYLALDEESQKNGTVSFMKQFGGDTFRYAAFLPDPGPTWQTSDFDFDEDYKRLSLGESLYNATNPDLRKFKAAGGKLIIFHGWADALVLPAGSVDYYETVEKTMGGRDQTEDFFRLFMMPGVNHCAGGKGAFGVDYLAYLENWVEKGEAPTELIGARMPAGNYEYTLARDWTGDKAEITRPHYPYPYKAFYKGSGDPDKAENYKPVQ